MNLFANVAELAASGFVFRITDNCGETADRYTVTFCDGDYLGMSGGPSHPQGVSMWGEGIDPQVQAEKVEAGTEIDLALGDLPEHIQAHIVGRLNEGFRDFLGRIEAGNPEACAPLRSKAEENQGLYTDTGVGLYTIGGEFYVRVEGEEFEDYGPYATAAEALRMTLPDDYSFSGPEYHPTLDVSRLEPSPDVAAKVAALEAIHDAAYTARLDSRLESFFNA